MASPVKDTTCASADDGDLEDFAIAADATPQDSSRGASCGVVQLKPRAASKRGEASQDELADAAAEGVPGVGKVFVRTWGCSHNVSDSEYMAGALEAYGYVVTDNEEDMLSSDCAVLNSCTVKGPSQQAFMNLVKKCQAGGVPLVVAGCVPQGQRDMPELSNVSIIGTQQIDRVTEAVEQTLAGNTVRLLSKATLPRLDMPKVRRNPLVEIIPLSTGCLGSCTYCKTRHARGVLGSYDPDAIVARAAAAVKDGVQEIWLSSEDTGAYGRDIGTSLVALLRRILEVLPQDASTMLRVGMTNPPFILQQLYALASILNDHRVFKFLHMPVQSGSNAVLHAMRREYTVQEFERVVTFLKRKVPGIYIATDIICGFPGETEADFEETLALVARHQFVSLNISQFYARPGTPAARMKQLGSHIKKDRSRRLTALIRGFNRHEHLRGSVQHVWVGQEVSPDGRAVGHTACYVKVLLPSDPSQVGKRVVARITGVSTWHVDAVPLAASEVAALGDAAVTVAPNAPLKASRPSKGTPATSTLSSTNTPAAPKWSLTAFNALLLACVFLAVARLVLQQLAAPAATA